MSEHKRRRRCLQFECMERREVLSGLTGAAGVISPLATPTQSMPFHLSGSGMPIGQITLPDGTSVQANLAKGQATFLGQFAGHIASLPSNGGNTVMALTNFYGDSGASLRTTISAFATGGSGGEENGRLSLIVRGRFYITGGTGTLIEARRAGTIIAIVEPEGNSFAMEFQGQVVA
jgi:hypothetical protein